MEKNNLIGSKIRELRKGKKLTLKELAEKISVSITYLSEVERGETGANEKIFTGIFREFGVNLAGIGQRESRGCRCLHSAKRGACRV